MVLGDVVRKRQASKAGTPRRDCCMGKSNKVEERARQVAQTGISSLDALQLASAKEGKADVILTCDDVLVRRSKRLKLALRVLNPVAYFREVDAHG